MDPQKPQIPIAGGQLRNQRTNEERERELWEIPRRSRREIVHDGPWDSLYLSIRELPATAPECRAGAAKGPNPTGQSAVDRSGRGARRFSPASPTLCSRFLAERGIRSDALPAGHDPNLGSQVSLQEKDIHEMCGIMHEKLVVAMTVVVHKIKRRPNGAIGRKM